MAHIACWEHYSSGEKSAWKAFFGAGREQYSNDLLFSNPVGHIACNALTVGVLTVHLQSHRLRDRTQQPP